MKQKYFIHKAINKHNLHKNTRVLSKCVIPLIVHMVLIVLGLFVERCWQIILIQRVLNLVQVYVLVGLLLHELRVEGSL